MPLWLFFRVILITFFPLVILGVVENCLQMKVVLLSVHSVGSFRLLLVFPQLWVRYSHCFGFEPNTPIAQLMQKQVSCEY